MVSRSTTYDYEQSSEGGRERHEIIPWTRLTDATPTIGDPAEVTGLPIGSQMTGTVINPGVAVTDPYAIINIAKGAVYRHNVRNVITYAGGPVEAAWRVINIGDTVYYDPEQDTLNGVKLSLAPLRTDGTTPNTIFGTVVLMQDEDSADYPKGTAVTPGTTHVCAIDQD